MKERFKSKRAYSLAEVMVVVVIILVVAAFGFISAIKYKKELGEQELDNTARSIFVAAQNHLTTACASGNWQKFISDSASDTSKLGTLMTNKPADADNDFDTTCTYWIISGNSAYDEVFEYLLPFGAIDESLWNDGSFIIEYNANTGTIYGVWYTDQGTAVQVEDGRSNRDNRMNYTPMMGYYGGATAALETSFESSTNNMTVSISNGNELVLYIKDYNSYDEGSSDGITKVTITGVTSGTTVDITSMALASKSTSDGVTTYTMVLDSITKSGYHFADLFSGLTPGEDIKIEVTTKIGDTTSVRSATENSLYGYISTSGDGYQATIKNGRHLQNLSSKVSGEAVKVNSAVIAADINWSDFIGTGTVYDLAGNSTSGKFLSIYNSNLNDINGNHMTLSGMSFAADSNGNAGLVGTADTGSITLRNIKLLNPLIGGDVTGSAGALLGSSTCAVNIENCKVTFSSGTSVYASGSAGAAVGSINTSSSASISGVQVSADEGIALSVTSSSGSAGGVVGSVKASSFELSDTYAVGGGDYDSISGAVHAGGLAGTVEVSTLNVDLSYASSYIKAGSGAAGGLVGYMSVTSSGSIIDTYVGGRTKYDAGSAEGTAASSYYDAVTTDGSQGRYNVISGGASYGAGGFIGVIASGSSVSVTDSYTTASAYSSAGGSAGGFIGTAASTSASINYCYSTGLVGSTTVSKAGCFIGLDSGVSATGNYYLSGINKSVTAASGTASAKNSSATAAGTGTSGSPFAGTSTVDSSTYNTMLSSLSYTFTSAAGLTHVGDWPIAGGGANIKVSVYWADRYYDSNGSSTDTFYDQKWKTSDYMSVTAQLWSYTSGSTEGTLVDSITFPTEEGKWDSGETWYDLPETDSEGNALSYVVRELYAVEYKDENKFYLNDTTGTIAEKNYLVYYTTQADPDEEDTTLWTIANVREYVNIYGELKWIDLDDSKRPEEVVLYVVRDNGVKVAYVANTRTILFAEDHVFRKDGLWPDNTDPDPSSYSRDLTYDGNTVENWSYDNTNGEWEFDFGYFQMRQSSDNYLYEYTVRQNPILVDGNQWYTTYANPYDDNVYHIEIENDVCFYVFYMTGATIEDSVIMTQEYKLTKNENSNATTYTATVISTKGVEYDVQVDGMNIVGWVEIEHVDDDDATVYAYNMNYQTRSSNSEEYYVDHDMTLVPVYAYSCTITYETCIPDVYVDAQVYAKGATTEAPEDPVYTDDYIFEGWYTSNDENADDYELYTFGQAINEDITLYAKWTTDKYASYTVIVWQQSASDWSPMMNSTLYKATGKYAQEENTYELYSYNYYDGDDETLDSNHRVRPFSSVQSLMDSVLISGQKEYSGLSIQGLYYASCDKNSVYFKSDGSTIINVYYDRYKFNIVFNGYYDSDSNLQTLFKDAGLVNGTTGKLTELKYVSNDKLSYADKRYESVTLKRDDDTFYGTISKESKTETQSVWVSGYWNYYEDNNGSYVYSDRLGQYRDRRRDDRGPYYSRTWVGGHYEDQEVETITYYFNATDGNKYVISKDDYGWAYYNKGGAQCNIYDSREEQVYYSQISYSYYNLDECITYSMTVHYTVTGTEYYFEYDSDGDGEITDDEKYYVSSYDGRIYSEDFSTYLYYYYNYKYNTIDYSYIRGYKGYTLYIYVTDPNASYKITFEGTEYDVKKTSDGYAYVTIGDTDYMLLSSMNNTSASYIRYAKLDQYKNSTIYYCYEYEVDLSYTTYYGLYGQALSTYEYKGKMLYPWPDSIAWNYTGSSTGLSFLGAFLSEEADLDTTSKTYTLSLTKNGTPGSQIYVYFCKQDINGNGTYTDSRDNSVTYNISNFAGYNSDWGINFSLSEKYEGYSLYSYSFDGVNWYEADTSVTVSLSRNGHNKLYIGFRCNTYEFSFVTGLNGDGEKNFTTDIFYGDTFSQYKGFPIMIGGSEITEYAADNGYTAKPHTSTDGWYLNTAGTIKASQIEEIYFPGSTLQSATQYVKGNEVLITELKIKDSSGNVTTEYIDASGKLFLGWYKDPAGAKEFDFDAIMPSANIVVYGVWQMPKVTISFASAPAYEGDTFTLNIDVYEDQVITVNSTNELRKPNTNPVRDDYRFMGWYVLNDDGEYVTAGFANPYTEDTTIYACWRSLESGYTMTYVVGGSTTVVVDTTTYMNGASARIKNYLPDDETIAEYGEFIGWNTKEDGTGEAYYPGLTYTFSNSNVTLYAQFAQED